MRRRSAGGRPRPRRGGRGGSTACNKFHCSSLKSVGYKIFCILPAWPPHLDKDCPTTLKMIFQTRSYTPISSRSYWSADRAPSQNSFEASTNCKVIKYGQNPQTC